MTLKQIFRQLELLNESSEEEALKFSDPDGVRSGKSGYSFGICQFDIANNGMAALCLQECNFSSEEIRNLKNQTIKNIAPYNDRLAAHADIVTEWDERQLSDCLSRATSMAEIGGWSYADKRALLYAADYHNQMYISKGGSFFNWAKSLGHSVTDYDIYKFRLNQTWGLKRPDDVRRRYANLLKVCQGAGI